VSIIERTGGLRKGAWFFSPDFYTAFRATVSQFLGAWDSSTFSVPSDDVEARGLFLRQTPFYSFFTTYSTLAAPSNYINSRWVAVRALDQKFSRMFLTASMQQRVYSN
jgi:hypothetical protein